MLSVTCNMLSFVRDSVGRAYAALKLSIIKQEWYQKVPQHNNWKTSMHRLHLSLGGGRGGYVWTFVKLPENPQDKVLYFFFKHPKRTPTNLKLQLQSCNCFLCVVDINFFRSFCLTLYVGMSSIFFLFHT